MLSETDKARCHALAEQLMEINRREWAADEQSMAAASRESGKAAWLILLFGIAITVLFHAFVYIMGLIT